MFIWKKNVLKCKACQLAGRGDLVEDADWAGFIAVRKDYLSRLQSNIKFEIPGNILS